MRTPGGIECRYFYGDYRRGKNFQECRLVDDSAGKPQWTPDLCKSCPVPEILRANACENLVLDAFVERTMLGLRRRVRVKAYCSLVKQAVNEPHIGCGQCHPLPAVFTKEQNDPDTAP